MGIFLFGSLGNWFGWDGFSQGGPTFVFFFTGKGDANGGVGRGVCRYSRVEKGTE